MRTRYSIFRLIGDLGGFSFAVFCVGNIVIRGFVSANLMINQIQKSFQVLIHKVREPFADLSLTQANGNNFIGNSQIKQIKRLYKTYFVNFDFQ